MSIMSENWYFHRKELQYGPYSWEEVLTYAREGNIAADDLIWSESLGEWKQVVQVPELVGLINQNVTVDSEPAKASSPKNRKLLLGLSAFAVVLLAVALYFFGIVDSPLPPDVQGPTSDYADLKPDGTYSFGLDVGKPHVSNQTLEADSGSTFGIKTAEFTAGNSSFYFEGVGLEMTPLFLEDSSASVAVKKMLAPEPLEGAVVNAYDFSALSREHYSGLYTLTIPYPTGEGLIGAGYYNETTKQWEPVDFTLDEANRLVTITTDHLSTFASFELSGEGTRYARITSNEWEADDFFYNRYGHNIHGKIVSELLENEMTPGREALDLGKSIVGDWFTASGGIFEFEGLAYSSEFLSGLSDAMGNVGTAMALAQLALDYQDEDQRAVAVGAFNFTRDWAIGKWGTKALKVSMIGVTAIDYSLNKLISELIQGRELVWYRAYEIYYRDNHVRNGREWFRIVSSIHDRAKNPEDFKELLNSELDEYTSRFWQEPYETILYYQGQAFSNWPQTGGGGENEKLRREISAAYKSQLLKETLEPVFRELEKQMTRKAREEYRLELKRLRNMLNQPVNFEIQEVVAAGEKSQYGSYIVQFGPLAESADWRKWTARLDQNGYLKGSFTVLGHLLAGAPDEIRLYKDRAALDKDDPELVVKFKVDVPDFRVVIGEVDLEPGTYLGHLVVEDYPLMTYMLEMKDDPGALSQAVTAPKSRSGQDSGDHIFSGCEEGLADMSEEMLQEALNEVLPAIIASLEETKGKKVPLMITIIEIGEKSYRAVVKADFSVLSAPSAVDDMIDTSESCEEMSQEMDCTVELIEGKVHITTSSFADDGGYLLFIGEIKAGGKLVGAWSSNSKDPDYQQNLGHSIVMYGSWEAEKQ